MVVEAKTTVSLTTLSAYPFQKITGEDESNEMDAGK
jgi:hypothetical protein